MTQENKRRYKRKKDNSSYHHSIKSGNIIYNYYCIRDKNDLVADIFADSSIRQVNMFDVFDGCTDRQIDSFFRKFKYRMEEQYKGTLLVIEYPVLSGYKNSARKGVTECKIAMQLSKHLKPTKIVQKNFEELCWKEIVELAEKINLFLIENIYKFAEENKQHDKQVAHT